MRQLEFGIVPPKPKLTPSRVEMLKRAHTVLSPGQQMAARRRADREEHAHRERMHEGPQGPRSSGLHQIRIP